MNQDLLGKLLSMASALLWALAVISFKKSSEQVGSVALNFVKNTIGVILFGLTLAAAGIPFVSQRSVREWLVVAASGIIGLGVADIWFFAALRRLGAGLNALVDCLYSPFVFLLSILLIREPVTLGVVTGGPLVISGLVLATVSKSERRRRDILIGIAFGASSVFAMALGLVILKPVLVAGSSTWQIIFWRTMAGTAATGLFLVFSKDRLKLHKAKAWLHLGLGAFLGTYLATAAWLFGMKLTNVTAAAILNQLSTFFILLAAALWLAEPLTKRKVVGAALAFAGASLVLSLNTPL